MAAPGAARGTRSHQVSAWRSPPARRYRPGEGEQHDVGPERVGIAHQVGQREWHSDHRHAGQHARGRRRPSASRARRAPAAARGHRVNFIAETRPARRPTSLVAAAGEHHGEEQQGDDGRSCRRWRGAGRRSGARSAPAARAPSARRAPAQRERQSPTPKVTRTKKMRASPSPGLTCVVDGSPKTASAAGTERTTRRRLAGVRRGHLAVVGDRCV